MLLKAELGRLDGLHAVVVGRSNIVGKPVAQFLLAENCTVTIAHSRSGDLQSLCRAADILVAAVGRPEMISGTWIKPGATVIDVGINRVIRDGAARLVGDVDFASALSDAGAITPVPGGVGPMTIACLLDNTVDACCRQNATDLRSIPLTEPPRVYRRVICSTTTRPYRVSSGLHETRLLCFCRRDVSDRAEKAAVVIPIDPFEGFPFDLAHRFPWADLVDDLGFEQADDTFGQGIVIGIADGSDREIDLGFGQALGILDRQVL